MPVASPAPSQTIARPTWRQWPWEELGVCLTYILGGAIWVVASDRALDYALRQPLDPLHLQTCKGLNFVATTGLLFYLVLRRSYTRRRRAEDESQALAQRFELAGRAASDVIWDWDLETDAIWWSEGFQTVFGYAKDEIEPTIESWTRRLHPGERARVEAGIQRNIQGGQPFWREEYRFRRKDGTYAVVQDRGYIIRDVEGKPVRMVGGITDITERREAAEQLEQSRRQLRALVDRVQTTREEERTRISREVHDGLGQLLSALSMDLGWMERRLSELETPAANPLLDRVVQATSVIDDTIKMVQKVAIDLRPGALDRVGLSAALRQEAKRFGERSGIVCQVDVPESLEGISPEAATVVFRIFQETVTNVARHADATEVQVRLVKEGAHLQLSVQDNGQGIPAAALNDPKALGLLGMKERAAALDGTVAVERVSPQGTRVTLRLPCVPPTQNLADMI